MSGQNEEDLQPSVETGSAPQSEEGSTLPPELRRELLELAANGGTDEMLPEGNIEDTATSASANAPEAFPGIMQSLISKQIQAVSPGSKIGGMEVSGEDPADPKRYIKGKDEKDLVPLMSEPTVEALDLATPEGKEKYEEIMDKIARGMGTYQMFEPEVGPEIIVDPKAKAGFRAIVVVKYCKVVNVVQIKRQEYTQVSEEELKEKFFSHHEPIKVDRDESTDGSESSGAEGDDDDGAPVRGGSDAGLGDGDPGRTGFDSPEGVGDGDNPEAEGSSLRSEDTGDGGDSERNSRKRAGSGGSGSSGDEKGDIPKGPKAQPRSRAKTKSATRKRNPKAQGGDS